MIYKKNKKKSNLFLYFLPKICIGIAIKKKKSFDR